MITDKIALYFDGEFPKRNYIKKFFTLCHENDYLNKELKKLNITTNIDAGKYQTYGCAFKIGVHKNIWFLFISSRFCEMTKHLDRNIRKKLLLKDILIKFKQIFSNKNSSHFPRLIQHNITDWYANKYIRGAWSSFPVGSKGKNACKLLQNHNNTNIFNIETHFNNNILFAGDYMISNGLGTVQGAFESGLSTGKRIVKVIMNHKKKASKL